MKLELKTAGGMSSLVVRVAQRGEFYYNGLRRQPQDLFSSDFAHNFTERITPFIHSFTF